jgi:apolipoprotein N-acyltransferase
LVRDGAQVIVVSTNNRSYERSANSAQHVAIGQLRAAETGRPVVQAAISGISAIIDADGVVHQRTKLFDRTVLQATVTTTSGETPYVRYGEWIIWTSGILLAGAVVLSIRREGHTPRKRKERAGFVDSPAPSDRPAESPGVTA